ncbi:hypothetical protein R1flu_025336 [Riccia fluitans]|uniref:Fe-S metabolism associated domain-containing protein n=1 Tax=Riccia fluitans TaxID=41844 RepID=A0ABD1XXI5_9MARC
MAALHQQLCSCASSPSSSSVSATIQSRNSSISCCPSSRIISVSSLSSSKFSSSWGSSSRVLSLKSSVQAHVASFGPELSLARPSSGGRSRNGRRVGAGVGRVESVQQQQQQELPTKLQEIVKLFEAVPDSKQKYEQLLYYAKQLKPLAKEFHTKENKVEGCVSQVWVKPSLTEDSRVFFEADSDSLLTKGLAALLVEGLSGATVSEILKDSFETPNFSSFGAPVTMSKKDSIQKKLQEALAPTILEVDDVSHQHAGHAGVHKGATETHFNVKVVSDKFTGTSLIKRHRLVYELLDEELKTGVHALALVTKTPKEIGQ